MDSDGLSRFSFEFVLAILFHLMLLFLLVLGLSFPADVASKKKLQAMQATILEIEAKAEEAPEAAKKLSKAEKKRLARAKRQAYRLAQAEKQKLLAAAAQDLVLEALQAKRLAQEISTIEVKIKSFWKRPVEIKNLACVIQISFSASGEVKNVTVTQSSGNKLFDDSAIEAIYKAKSFQIPTDESVRQEMLAGIAVHFGDE